ncbi:unnamed protein product [Schistocephalus solidus]|uniref:Uncharacterized protein n=1 Tax=Schistocephalus solidus TaxID=70667 RepID=A0A183SLB8_SCHSO|nr:unnamed protein product [Schistocephalus solidus]
MAISTPSAQCQQHQKPLNIMIYDLHLRSYQEATLQSGIAKATAIIERLNNSTKERKLVRVTKLEEVEPWEIFSPRFQSTPIRESIGCAVADAELSRCSSQMTGFNSEMPSNRNATREDDMGTKIPEEAQGEKEVFATPLGAVFGAPIETQEQCLQQPYPVDDLLRIHPDLFKNPRELSELIIRYVEFLPSRLIEGMDVWRSALSTLASDSGRELYIPETSVEIVLEPSPEVTGMRFTSFQFTGDVLVIQGEIGAYFRALDHLILHFHKVWQQSARPRSPEEMVRLFMLLSRILCGQPEHEIVQVMFDFVNQWPEIRQGIIGEWQEFLLEGSANS